MVNVHINVRQKKVLAKDRLRYHVHMWETHSLQKKKLGSWTVDS